MTLLKRTLVMVASIISFTLITLLSALMLNDIAYGANTSPPEGELRGAALGQDLEKKGSK